jgi:hypothetical protein
MKIHLSLNENTFTFVLPQKSDFWEGRAGGVRKEKHGQLSAYGSARRKRRQLLATREFKDVQIGTMIFPNDLGITPQLFSCALLCIILLLHLEVERFALLLDRSVLRVEW